jgi:serine protease Do
MRPYESGAGAARVHRINRWGRCLAVVAMGWAASFAAANELPEMWAERLATVVAVEFTIETELERQPGLSLGVVADREGRIILPNTAIHPRATPAQVQDFRIYRPGEPTTSYAPATYLGQDAFTGWHFLQVKEDARAGLRPISDFAGPRESAEPRVAEEVWGIGLRKKDEDFRPYLLMARISLVQSLPHRTAIALDEVAGPGLPVFDRNGVFLGLGQPGFGESLLMFTRQRGGEQIVLVNPDECPAFRLADEILPYLDRVPGNVFGRPLAWLGVGALQPLDPEVARFLQLEAQAGLVASEVMAGSPAQQAGLQERDIILSIDQDPLPRLKPDAIVGGFFERELARRAPGDRIVLGVMRGNERLDVPVTLAEAPTLPREAPRQYYERLGLTARELVFIDAVERRADPLTARGVIAHFVKPNGPAGTAGLRLDDWIQQIDGVDVADYAAAIAQLGKIEADERRPEFVLQVRRGGETAILRVRLN